MSSPTQKSLKHMRDLGYTCFITETWNSFTKQRNDLFGFADLICLGDNIVIAVQTTSGSHLSDRVKKITDHVNVAAVRKAGIAIHAHGWTKGKNGRYTLREVDLS